MLPADPGLSRFAFLTAGSRSAAHAGSLLCSLFLWALGGFLSRGTLSHTARTTGAAHAVRERFSVLHVMVGAHGVSSGMVRVMGFVPTRMRVVWMFHVCDTPIR